ncbi:MAG: hypothetical protein A4E35_01864 [Methanoregula sp. PtaU1.Bin051]|nr:MAG: hypothetical protein A4E35_01864 [Methanoregula sp. PtaU1.Bin051]
MNPKKSGIQLSRDVIGELANLGQFGESYEDVVVRLLETNRSNMQGVQNNGTTRSDTPHTTQYSPHGGKGHE